MQHEVRAIVSGTIRVLGECSPPRYAISPGRHRLSGLILGTLYVFVLDVSIHPSNHLRNKVNYHDFHVF